MKELDSRLFAVTSRTRAIEIHGKDFSPKVSEYLIKGDLLQVPVFNVEEQDHSSPSISTGQDSGVSSLYSTTHSLRDQLCSYCRKMNAKMHEVSSKTVQLWSKSSQKRMDWMRAEFQRQAKTKQQEQDFEQRPLRRVEFMRKDLHESDVNKCSRCHALEHSLDERSRLQLGFDDDDADGNA
ncbi:hypothetical protein DNTS_018521 [Danionella cerebrum]|uniref:Uncharacterized protein n=1 Tax=Danionella cerebrum TaxID=2873325 RepID=A0A553Q1B0_9TELE|nr:hypothetical protein DNTS_018521 [Danionella translucida]